MVLVKDFERAKIRFARRLDHLEFFDALIEKDNWVFDGKDCELETVLKPIITNKLNVTENFVALNEVVDFVVVVFS